MEKHNPSDPKGRVDESHLRSHALSEDSQLLQRTEEIGRIIKELLRECGERVSSRSDRPDSSERQLTLGERTSIPLLRGPGAGVKVDPLAERLEGAGRMLEEFLQTIRRFHDLARCDALTGLPNRRAFDDRVDRMVADSRARPISLVFMDIDAFKQINDRYGHSIGDQVLRFVGDCLREGAGVDAMVARFGGEEFTLLACETGDLAVQRVERCQRLIASRSDDWGERGLAIRFSAGVAELTSGERVGDWFRRADLAMYAAKRFGRERVVLHQGGFLWAGGERFELGSCLVDDLGRAAQQRELQRREGMEGWPIEASHRENLDRVGGTEE